MLQLTKTQLLIVLLMIFYKISIAEAVSDTLSVSVTVVNEKNQPMELAVVTLVRTGSNGIEKTAITDTKGNAYLKIISPGQYYCITSFTSYAPDTSAGFTYKSRCTAQRLFIHLHPQSSNLQEVVVRGIKPFVQFEKGKTIVNPDASPSNAGTSIMELLEKMPGVTIDQNGVISLKAKSNVLVMIDGKPTYLSGTDLSNLLGSMSSAQVDQIELITNPPARYDASGNAGIINIKTKKK